MLWIFSVSSGEEGVDEGDEDEDEEEEEEEGEEEEEEEEEEELNCKGAIRSG